MKEICLAIIILIDLIYYIIIIDIILSWLSLSWKNFRIKFINSILDPIYEKIRNNIPTSIWPFEFTPIILVLFLIIIKSIVLYISPESGMYY